MITLTQDQPSQPAIRTREQFTAVVENIFQIRRDREELWHEQEREIAAVREKYRAQLAETERCLDLETSWAEAWARAHPEIFSPDRTLVCGSVLVGFRVEPPRIERASRRWTWSRIARTLAELPWGQKYLRLPPPEVDREALLADLGTLSPEDLRNAGMKILQGERFVITPNIPEPLREAA